MNIETIIDEDMDHKILLRKFNVLLRWCARMYTEPGILHVLLAVRVKCIRMVNTAISEDDTGKIPVLCHRS